MALKGPEYITCDVLVVGGGGAGLRAAIAAREAGASVAIVSKSNVGLGNNTVLSKATFAAAIGTAEPRDNPEVHVQDTLKGGRFINDAKLVEKMARTIAREIPLLEKMGIAFARKDGKIVNDLASGHCFARHVSVQTRRGSGLSLPLKQYASKVGVRFIEKVFVTALLGTGHGLNVAGVDEKGRFLVFVPRTVVLATGGFCQVYLCTNNASGITGDGQALAFQAGVPLRDMEFVQFYPTSFGMHLVSYESFVDYFGAPLRNSLGEDVVDRHNLRERMSMTRDRVARAVMKEILEGRDVNGGVVMDLSGVAEADLERCRGFLPPGMSPEKKELQVSPVAHFCMGGIVTDEDAQTCMPGLFACGEVAGGVHGANRLAGNALAEVFAMGRVAGENAAEFSREKGPEGPALSAVSAEMKRLDAMLGEEQGDLAGLVRDLKQTMWYKGGIVRNGSVLEQALAKLGESRSLTQKVKVADTRGLRKLLELNNMSLVAETVLTAALERQESRGAHYREDYPDEDPGWQATIFLEYRDNSIKLHKKTVRP